MISSNNIDGTSSGLCESYHMRRIAKLLENYNEAITLQRHKGAPQAIQREAVVLMDPQSLGYYQWFTYNCDCLVGIVSASEY